MLVRPPFPTVLDSTLISTFRSCPRKFYLEYLHHYKPREPSVHLHAGGAFAKGLEVARKAFYVEHASPDEALAQGLAALFSAYGSFACPPDSAKSCERMAGALEYYFSQYPLLTDSAVPLTLPSGSRGIEFSFAEPIDATHPETGDPLIYCGRMDMIVEFAGGVFGEDDKTTSSLGASWAKQWDLRCFDSRTELLTANGWKYIDNVVEGEHVIQYAAGKLEYIPAADVHSSHHDGVMVALESGRLNQLITPNHRILLELRHGGTNVVEAGDLHHQDGQHKIPLSGKLTSEKLPKALQQYIVALQADGSLRPSKGKVTYGQGHREHSPHAAAYFKFSKQRKIDRLKWILRELDTTWEEHADGGIYVSGFSALQEMADKLLDENKIFRPDTFDLYDETFLEELELWDGWASQYYTTVKPNADFVQTVAHINAWRASVQLKINHTQSYVVCLSKQITCDLKAIAISDVNWSDKVYCLSVPSGFLLTRRNGVISISGNSQFTGYTWAAARAGFPMQGFLIRGVSILKTKYDTQQAVTYRPQWMLDRWYEQLLRDIARMKECWESGLWDYNLDHSCTEFGACLFRQVCLSADPQPWLNAGFERREWNPLTREEAPSLLPHNDLPLLDATL